MGRSFLLIFLFLISAGAVTVPPNWGDFQMGLLNNGRPLWDDAMKDAQNVAGNPYKLDRRYMYIADTNDMKSFWGEDHGDNKNWSKDPYYVDKGVRPASVVYMVQRGGDGWETVDAGMADSAFMHEYFRYLCVMADSGKGQQPIYVIEPDVWTYMLQYSREHDPDRYSVTKDDWSLIKNNHFDDFCHINDLGYPWLEEFENKASNLPGAIIKTLKMRDPQCYAGILIGFWGFAPSTQTTGGLFKDTDPNIDVSARETGKFVQALLNSTPYKGDFCGLEKNGTDLGYWKTIGSALYNELNWDDRSNAAWIRFAKTISDSTDLPMIGWQIAIGNSTMPDTLSAYSDSYFPYFFTHTQDYIDAGFIGMLAGASNQDRGTLPTVPGLNKTYFNGTFGKQVKGDEGWWYSQYANFNTKRPWLAKQDTFYTVIAEVLPESTFTAGEVTDPLWEISKEYGTAEHGKTYCYNGRQYEFSGWYSAAGTVPTADPSQWTDKGLYGTWNVVVGGTVDNSSVFYKTGTTLTHNFKPVPIEGYGIGTMTVNGDTVSPSAEISVNSISKDYRILVRFVKGGSQVAVNEISKASSGCLCTVDSRAVTLNRAGTVELFSLNGRKISSVALNAGGQFLFSGIASGTYVTRISSAGTVMAKMVMVR